MATKKKTTKPDLPLWRNGGVFYPYAVALMTQDDGGFSATLRGGFFTLPDARASARQRAADENSNYAVLQYVAIFGSPPKPSPTEYGVPK